ncbi:MAG TPA: TetR/AcrR family transcriptional regulator [Trebonia sp.]
MREVARERNRRGEGARLREDILAGATELLEQTGSEEAVTLRAVARQVGISAPSIYAHFADREAIVAAIIDGAFSDFNAAIEAATDAAARAGGGPRARLRAGCAGYLEFAAERPNRYKLLFERRDLLGNGPEPSPMVRLEGFMLLIASVQACIDVGISSSDDPARDATAIWVALHGFATLHSSWPGFPWPDQDAMLDRIVYGLAQLHDA